jgi:hypothetical protein
MDRSFFVVRNELEEHLERVLEGFGAVGSYATKTNKQCSRLV